MTPTASRRGSGGCCYKQTATAGGKKLQGVEVLHSLLADHAERLLVWALGGATVKAARLAKMIPVIVLHCLKGHHEDPVEEEPPKPRKPRKSTFQQLPR